MASYAVGVDLGQVQDYTAIAVVGLDERYLAACQARDEAYKRLSCARQDPHLDEVDLRIIEREIDEEEDSMPEPVYEVRHLERLPLGTRYPEVVGRIKALLSTPPLADECALAVDATGVGVAVTDMLRNAGLHFDRVTITSGEKEIREGSRWRVPKRDLISTCQVLLQQRRLKIAASLPGLALVFRIEDGRRAIPGIRRRPERAAAVADHVADIVSRQRWTEHSPLFALAIGAEEVDAIFRSGKHENIDRCRLIHCVWISQHSPGFPTDAGVRTL